MEQHPVPQQISSYQFKLVGDMTLKQFFEVAGGVVIALIIYSMPLPAFMKWPLIIIFVLFGAALAFLPIEERPLEQWLMAFIRSIYQPTQFYWKKAEVKPLYFMAPTAAATPAAEGETVSAPTSAPNATFLNNLESGEKAFFSNITRLFNIAGSTKPTSAPVETATIVNAIITPATTPIQKSTPVARPFATQNMVNPRLQTIPTTPPPQVKKVVIPQLPQIQVEKSSEPIPQTTPAMVATPVMIKTEAVNQILPNQPIQIMAQPQTTQFSPEAAPPATPTTPNIVVGQVMDNQGKIVEGAILEIKDLQGRPVRALKSNKVGHFFIVTPLGNGQYQLTVEKDGLEFAALQIDANGQIIQPLSLRATTAQQKDI